MRIVVGLGVAVLVAAVVLGVAGFAYVMSIDPESDVAVGSGPDVTVTPTPEAPPSRRGAEDLLGSEAAPGPAFSEVRCTFAGRSIMDPGLPTNPFARTRQRMTLAPGATFACSEPGDGTAGSVELEAKADDLGLFSGVLVGDGRITWERLPPERSKDLPRPWTSGTQNEIELAFPDIFVWFTITDGPYAGSSAVIRLSRWELVKNDAGDIVGVIFEPTEFEFGIS